MIESFNGKIKTADFSPKNELFCLTLNEKADTLKSGLKRFFAAILSFFLIVVICINLVYLFFFALFNSQVLEVKSATLRNEFSKNDFLQIAFQLGRLSDAKRDLLLKDLDIIVIPTASFSLENTVSSNITQKIAEVTEKKVNILTDKTFERQEITNLSEENLGTISKDAAKKAEIKNYLAVILLNKSKDVPTNIGMAEGERTIVLFEGRIAELSETQSILDELRVSTVLHEYGHLIGLEHNNNEGCLMNKKVESPGNNWSASMTEDFCDFEKSQIEELK